MTNTLAARRYRGSVVEERRALRRQQLIAAAAQVYGSNGYRHSSVKQVCEAAGLTQRYFYESFAHSDELLIACYEQTARNLRDEITAAAEAAGADRVACARAMALAYFQALKERPLMANLLLVEIRGISPAVDRAIIRALNDVSRDMARLVATPGYRPDDLAYAGVLGGIIHIALQWIGNGYRQPAEAVAEVAVKMSSALLLQPEQL